MVKIITTVSTSGASVGGLFLATLAADFGGLRSQSEHMGSDCAVGSDRPFGWIELTMLVYESLEPGAEASMGRADHDLRVKRRPGGQAAYPTVEFARGCIAHPAKDDWLSASASLS
jgi:hypothetical protein